MYKRQEIYHVEGLENGDKEEPTLSLIKYTPTDISGKKESIGFEKCKNDIQTVFHPLSSREEAADVYKRQPCTSTYLSAARYSSWIGERLMKLTQVNS